MKLDEPTPEATDAVLTPSEKLGERKHFVLDWTAPPSPLRGLLTPPPDVVEFVNRENARLPASPAYRQWMLDYLSMDYYFGGHWICYRDTRQGAEVLAVGFDEMTKLKQSLSPAGREGIISRYCSRWQLPKSTEPR